MIYFICVLSGLLFICTRINFMIFYFYFKSKWLKCVYIFSSGLSSVPRKAQSNHGFRHYIVSNIT